MEDQELARLPQSPPDHAEGPTVLDRVLRMREMLARAKAGELSQIEELAREKAYRTDIRSLELLLAREAELFEVFARTHAIGVSDVVRFTAPSGSRGARERVEDVDHYLKLYRSTTIGVHTEFPMTTFFDQYEIQVMDHGYARASARRLTDGDPRLECLVRLHEEWMDALRRRPGKGFFQSIERQVRKCELALDLVPALILLLCVSSVRYKEGIAGIDVQPLFRYLQLEGMIGSRTALRKQELEREEKRAVKEALRSAGLLEEAIFTLIGVTNLRDRGVIMEEIRRAVVGAEPLSAFPRLAPVLDRVTRARLLLTKR